MPHSTANEVVVSSTEYIHMVRYDERNLGAAESIARPRTPGAGPGHGLNGRPQPGPSKSYLNLTNSALQGVFGSQVSLAELTGDVSQPPTRPGTPHRESLRGPAAANLVNGKLLGRQSPATVGVSPNSAKKFSPVAFVRGLVVLFLFGAAYGQLSKRLHDNHNVSTWTLDIDHTGVLSLLWGSQGIVLGAILPIFDMVYPERGRVLNRGKGGADWSSIVRASAAFLGIAYGVRKLAWSSTSQAAFYWGMVNPCLWYILDATRNGFIVGSLTGIVGALAFALVFPDHLPEAGATEAYLSVVAWVASVLFCCSICFGNLGRRLLVVDADTTDSSDE